MLATLFAGAEAFTLPDVSSTSSRRAVLTNAAASFAVLAAPSAALAVAARTGLEAPFTGEYDDPKASGCLRSVKVVGPKMGTDGRKRRGETALIKGIDGKTGGACNGEPEIADVWKIEGIVAEDGVNMKVDFTAKGKSGDALGEKIAGLRDELKSAQAKVAAFVPAEGETGPPAQLTAQVASVQSKIDEAIASRKQLASVAATYEEVGGIQTIKVSRCAHQLGPRAQRTSPHTAALTHTA